MRLWLVCLPVLAGCNFGGPGSGDIDANNPPIKMDAATEGEPGCASYSDQFDSCKTQVPTGGEQPLLLGGINTYNTDTHVLTTNLGNNVTPPHVVITGPAGSIDLIFASTFTLSAGATLNLRGNTVAGFAIDGAVQIEGLIDLTSDGSGARNDDVCLTSVGAKGPDNDGGAGGGGGAAFAGVGGVGGKGNSDGTQATPGGAGGVAQTRPLGPLGGCDGGDGGGTNNPNRNGGAAGDGGGAILIASRTSITVTASGAINAGGGGGKAANDNGTAGGGGGSGGMILLQSPIVNIQGTLAANGGSGGEGNADANPGASGRASNQPAPGGKNGDPTGGDGADGSAGATLAGPTAVDFELGGGGGGGGGAGFIAIQCTSPNVTGGTISPPFGVWP